MIYDKNSFPGWTKDLKKSNIAPLSKWEKQINLQGLYTSLYITEVLCINDLWQNGFIAIFR